jgi:hypothetical protein
MAKKTKKVKKVSKKKVVDYGRKGNFYLGK